MTELERDQFGFHVVFVAVAVAVLLLRPAGPVGPWLLGLVLTYDVGTLGLVLARGHRRWLTTWAFGAVLSLWMVLPDAVLAVGLGVLDFPPDGLPRLGAVTAPMAVLWTIPTVVIVGVADAVTRRRGDRAGWTSAIVTAGVVFGTAEAALPYVPVWRAVDVATVGEAAVYILPAELFLGAAMLAGARWCRGSGWIATVGVSALVALAYTGAATVSWLVIERGLLG